MSVISDPISDLLIRLKNATLVAHQTTEVPQSKLNTAILKILQKQAYILAFAPRAKSWPKMIKVDLHYNGKLSVLQGVKRISKPGARIYVHSKDMPTVRSGVGIAIVSTSAGLMTSQEAKKNNLGGEVLAHIW